MVECQPTNVEEIMELEILRLTTSIAINNLGKSTARNQGVKVGRGTGYLLVSKYLPTKILINYKGNKRDFIVETSGQCHLTLVSELPGMGQINFKCPSRGCNITHCSMNMWFLPNTHNLHVIVKTHQTSTNWGSLQNNWPVIF